MSGFWRPTQVMLASFAAGAFLAEGKTLPAACMLVSAVLGWLQLVSS